MEKTLRAWRNYELAERCFYKLHKLDSPGEFEDWDVYWTAAITSCRTIWYVLREQDLVGSNLRKLISKDYDKWAAKSNLLQSFVREQRNRTTKKGFLDITEIDVMVGQPRGTPFHATHKDLIFTYSTPKKPALDVPENLQGEDPIRLLGLAIRELHEDLSVIEVSIIRKYDTPFSTMDRSRIYSESEFFSEYPDFYR